ncbi:hypothetical protein COC43_03270 [Bacillus thuringiensis]|uniref:phospholipase D-like domain-containing protein n=1 Tax=Bacillus thuringiensis TaxID=1428 RepID=UPI000BFCF964|nr:phospholipase D-like domain-containing protein [Bacillus thuringiensis]PGR82059.1 hypothetical protein COC43_03270 [Bacillus thuringiensis]
MNKIHFKNHQDKISQALLNTKNELLIAVAWISFDLYKDIFIRLAKNGVKIKIIVNDDYINNRHNECIELLKEEGIKIKKLRTAYANNFMHHKFCIIDGKKLLIGSFNWSKNAKFNFENLLEIEDKQLILETVSEFKYLWKLTKKNIQLHKKKKCERCSNYKYNLMILNSSNIHTEYKIVSVCDCDSEYTELVNDFVDISLYNSIIDISESYGDEIELLKEYNEHVEALSQVCEHHLEQIYSLNQEYKYHLELIFQQLQIEYPIHGVALLKYDILFQDGDGEWFAHVLWKDRFAYELEERYYNSFNFL